MAVKSVVSVQLFISMTKSKCRSTFFLFLSLIAIPVQGKTFIPGVSEYAIFTAIFLYSKLLFSKIRKWKGGDTLSISLASAATVYDRYAIANRFTTNETAIRLNQGNIYAIVSESEIIQLKNGNKTMYSRLANVEINLQSITLAVSSSEYKNMGGVLSAITQARSSISLNAQQISLKVSKDNIISSINQTSESVKISANKIALTGNGIISIINSGTTTISANKIALTGDGIISIINSGTTTISANKIALTGDGIISLINSGTTTINAGKINLSGYITATDLKQQGATTISGGQLTCSNLNATNGSFTGNITSVNANITGGKISITNGGCNTTIQDGNIDFYYNSAKYGDMGTGYYGLTLESMQDFSIWTPMSSSVAGVSMCYLAPMSGNGQDVKRNRFIGGVKVQANTIVFDSGYGVQCGDYRDWLMYSPNGNQMVVGNTDMALFLKGTACYANGSTIQTSDENKKNSIQDLDSRYITLIKNLHPLKYRMNDGTSGRLHTGFTLQDVKKAMDKSGLTTKDLAAYVEYDDTDFIEDGGRMMSVSKGKTGGLRYEEFISPIVYCLKSAMDEIEALKFEILQAYARIDVLEKE